jgi:hypothetical protein
MNSLSHIANPATKGVGMGAARAFDFTAVGFTTNHE